MSGTYLSSKATLDELLANDKFVYRAKLIVNLDKGTPEYLTAYRALNNLIKELGITDIVRVIKSDGGVWFCSFCSPERVATAENHNTRPEIMVALNYAFGNPVTNTKIYPKDLKSSVLEGYGFAERRSSSFKNFEQYVAYTYKPSPSPLSTNVFTVRVAQVLLQ